MYNLLDVLNWFLIFRFRIIYDGGRSDNGGRDAGTSNKSRWDREELLGGHLARLVRLRRLWKRPGHLERGEGETPPKYDQLLHRLLGTGRSPRGRIRHAFLSLCSGKNVSRIKSEKNLPNKITIDKLV